MIAPATRRRAPDRAWRAWLLGHYWNAPIPPTTQAVADALGDTPLKDLCEHLPLYSLWTAEAVAALAAWIQACDLRRVVEVGAGDGCLTRWLRPLLLGVTLIATDSGAWRTVHPLAPVVRAEARQAPHAFHADGVLSSWMPYGTDWTPAWRATPRVRAYVLIGEGPDGCVGTASAWLPEDRRWAVEDVPRFDGTSWCRTDMHHPYRNLAWGYVREVE